MKSLKQRNNILLVEPSFPFPTKSKNRANSIHKNFIPIGLLKFSSYYKSQGCKVKLVRGRASEKEIGFYPDEILVTSIFTYWSQYVWDAISYYREIFEKSEIKLGGIYATLHRDKQEFKSLVEKYNVKVFCGVQDHIEGYLPDYSLTPGVEHHATHVMRGCIRKCNFCGTWRIEPKLKYKDAKTIMSEIFAVGKNKIIFYDNNMLANPNIEEILNNLCGLKINKKPVLFESQSGFDGRLLENKPHLATLLKKAKFQSVRIAWDNSLEDSGSIKNQINILKKAGYQAKDISVFMIYNFNMPYEDMVKKLKYCRQWGVQISDCRYRPLDATYDYYKPNVKVPQTCLDYYIHETSGWTDKKVKSFRRLVREHNIWIRYAKDKGLEYDKEMERWSAINNTYKFFKLGTPPKMQEINRNAALKERIALLNRAKGMALRNNLPDVNIKSMSNKKIRDLIQAD